MAQELETTIEDAFSWFEDIPVAAASIGQVHLGNLRTGEAVAIKIQRPGVMKMVGRDLDIISDLAVVIEKRWEWARQYQLTRIVQELSKSMMAELDYSQEARNTEKIALQFQHNRHIYIPRIYWEYTSSRILTMEYVEGIMVRNRQELIDKGYDLKEIAERITNGMLHQIFIEGFFHGDPHPGNLLVRKDGSIAFIDFGMVGRISTDMKEHLSELIIALMRKNSEGMVRAILKLSLFPVDGEIAALRADLDRLQEEYYDISFSEMSMGKALNDLFGVARQHQIIIPPDLTLLGKALLTLEGVVENLDPSLSIIDMAEPFGKKLVKERFSIDRLRKKLSGGLGGLLEGILDFPSQARQLSSLISKGKLKLEISIPELQALMRKLDQISNRLSISIVLLAFSIIMAALIIGSAMNNETSILWQLPVIGIGFIVALLMVLWLLYGIFKSGRF
ncbi:putative protein kinase UbiB [compost metagenome]